MQLILIHRISDIYSLPQIISPISVANIGIFILFATIFDIYFGNYYMSQFVVYLYAQAESGALSRYFLQTTECRIISSELRGEEYLQLSIPCLITS